MSREESPSANNFGYQRDTLPVSLKITSELLIKLGRVCLWNSPWSTRRRYRQTEFDGCYVYELKSKHHNKGGQPPHFCCPQCFSNRKLRTLQHISVGWQCLECQSVLYFQASPNHGPISRVRMMR